MVVAAAGATEDQTLLRSIFVKNVHFTATVEEVKQHFKECGEMLRVTIGLNKVTRKPLGYCYIEFTTKESAIRSKTLNESLFKGRQITVVPKRKNVPHKGSSAARANGSKHALRNQNALVMHQIKPMMAYMMAMTAMGQGAMGGGGHHSYGAYRGARGRGARGRGGRGGTPYRSITARGGLGSIQSTASSSCPSNSAASGSTRP